MLKVKTFLNASVIHGIGIFADENIVKGSVIWEFNPYVDLVYTPEQWCTLAANISVQSFAALRRYSYKEKGNYYVCFDNAQFMNHCAVGFNVENHQEANQMLARSDIRKGEELLCNYFQYSDSDDEHRVLLQTLNS